MKFIMKANKTIGIHKAQYNNMNLQYSFEALVHYNGRHTVVIRYCQKQPYKEKLRLGIICKLQEKRVEKELKLASLLNCKPVQWIKMRRRGCQFSLMGCFLEARTPKVNKMIS